MIKLAEELGLDDVARGIKETMRIQNETKQIVPGANRSMSEPSNVASIRAKQKFNLEDDYTVYAMSEIDRHMLNKVDDIPWSARSTFIAEREAYKRYLTTADLQEAMSIRNADRIEDDAFFNSKGHLQKIIEEKSGKKIPELLDEIKDELNLPKNQIEWAESDSDFIAQWGSINDLEDTRSAIEKAQSRWGGADVSRVEEVFGEGNVQSKGDLITATKTTDTSLTARQTLAEQGRVKQEQDKRRELLSSPESLLKYAEERGLSAEEMKQLLSDNLRANTDREMYLNRRVESDWFKKVQEEEKNRASKIQFKASGGLMSRK
jgi:hypothetical protein